MNNELFGGVFYINLEYRQDRKEEIENELNKMELKYKRFNAFHHEFGIAGCTKSHLEVIKLAKEQKLKNVLIFEDDFESLVSKDVFWKEINNFFNKKIDYDVLMLGYNLHQYNSFDDQLYKIIHLDSPSGYIVNEKFYDQLIECWETHLPLLISTRNWQLYANDAIMNKIVPQNKWYALKTRIGKQRSSFSDIRQSYMVYKW